MVEKNNENIVDSKKDANEKGKKGLTKFFIFTLSIFAIFFVVAFVYQNVYYKVFPEKLLAGAYANTGAKLAVETKQANAKINDQYENVDFEEINSVTYEDTNENTEEKVVYFDNVINGVTNIFNEKKQSYNIDNINMGFSYNNIVTLSPLESFLPEFPSEIKELILKDNEVKVYEDRTEVIVVYDKKDMDKLLKLLLDYTKDNELYNKAKEFIDKVSTDNEKIEVTYTIEKNGLINNTISKVSIKVLDDNLPLDEQNYIEFSFPNKDHLLDSMKIEVSNLGNKSVFGYESNISSYFDEVSVIVNDDKYKFDILTEANDLLLKSKDGKVLKFGKTNK